MAYNLEPLIRIVEQTLHSDHRRGVLDHHEITQIESLREKASSLKTILESSSPLCGRRMTNLESEIRDAAHKAEDIIELHMLWEPRDGRSLHMAQVIQQLESAMAQLENMSPARPDTPAPAAPINPFSPVGLNDDLLQLKDRLTGQAEVLGIIPIVGAGGIGKTTFARNLYNDPLVVEHFDVRAWVTVSIDYNLPEILLDILRCVTEDNDIDYLLPFKHLVGEQVHKKLFGRRYLIVLDDVWSWDALCAIKRSFPDNNNGSRIILTTRQSDVYGSSAPHTMRFLDESDSWKLLKQKVFAGEGYMCPAALERIGKEIAAHCRGLPLAIDVIGGLLSKAQRTPESWELVGKDITSVLSADMGFYRILSLSYDHLPDHLKPCFLYMGAFPQNYEVPASKLIRLWIAEGFVKGGEEVAAAYLEALVSRGLLLVQDKDGCGKAKSYSIHDCLRDLCVEKAKQEKFLCVRNQKDGRDVLEGRWRRVSVDPSYCLQDLQESRPPQLVRSFLCIAVEACHELPSTVVFGLRLLRVLDLFNIEFHQFPGEVIQLVNLRYLAMCCNQDHIPADISRLGNLQTLIVRSNKGYIDIPAEIWKMRELIHVRLKKTVIWFQAAGGLDNMTTLVHEKLQTISIANLYGLISSGFLIGVSNIKKLGICFDFSPLLVNLGHLHKLETLKVLGNYQSELKLPLGIKKLTLRECFLTGAFMMSVSSLPSLEVLKIQKCDFQSGQEEELMMQPSTEKYSSLQCLLLENSNLMRWPADWTHFSQLRSLAIRRCLQLNEIPGDIGDITTLEIIDLQLPTSALKNSVVAILKEQAYYGNYDLKVSINSSTGTRLLSARDFKGA